MKYLILSLLQEPMSFPDILNYTKGDRLTVVSILHKMIRSGLIGKTGKRRHYIYFLTNKGLVVLYIMRLKRMLKEVINNA